MVERGLAVRAGERVPVDDADPVGAADYIRVADTFSPRSRYAGPLARFRRRAVERQFGVGHIESKESAECIAGEVLQGHKKPHDCPAFGIHCTPDRPLGAPMVSSEGACAAYYRYRRGFDGGRR